MNIITSVNKRDMRCDFYNKHDMCSVEWKLKAMINKNKNQINKFDCNWRHSLNRKIEICRV